MNSITRRCAAIASVIAIASSLAACAQQQGPYGQQQPGILGDVGMKQGIGAVLGAAGGGLLGSQFGKGSGNLAMTAVGALAGGLIGSSIGSSMDQTDRMQASQSQQQAIVYAQPGQQVGWQNPQTGNRGWTVAQQPYPAQMPTPQGAYPTNCREYQTTVMVGGKQQVGYGTACLGPDGQWKIVSQ
jgi:surface antigen